MARVSERPTGANVTDPSSAPRALRWSDSNDIRTWIDAARTCAADLTAAAREAMRRPSKRVLSRSEIRRRVRRASGELAALLDAAAGGADLERASVGERGGAGHD